MNWEPFPQTPLLSAGVLIDLKAIGVGSVTHFQK